MKQTTSFLATVLVMFIAFATSCASSDKDRAAADSIARADSILHAYDQGIDLVANFTKVAEKAETMTADSDWAAYATEVGNAIVERDLCDSKGTISADDFQRFNELLGNISTKVESLPQAVQDAYNAALAPLLEKAASADTEIVTEEIVNP